MDIRPLRLPGCYEIRPPRLADQRGCFVKPFRSDVFRRLGMEVDFQEQYYSESVRGVLRGMHFQTPPTDHAKLVYCVRGHVLDAGIDLRRGSPTYGEHVVLELSSKKGNAVFLPRGIAHGFYVVDEQATVVYSVTSVHSPDHDRGVRWNSAGIRWPTTSPIVSERDAALPPLDGFDSPFIFEPDLLRRAS